MIAFHKKEVINFRTFMEMKNEQVSIKDKSQFIINPKIYSIITVEPSMFIDKKFLIIAGCIVIVALIEKSLAKRGNIAIAEGMYIILKLLFPVVALIALCIIISKLTFF